MEVKMGKQDMNIPFGLLFEEVAPNPKVTILPSYSEEKDLSFVEDAHGQPIPYVEFGASTGTLTETKVHQEGTDTDPEDDHAGFSYTGTTTSTAVEAEMTDTDPSDDHEHQPVWRSFMGTDTFTEAAGEPTDKD
jgi:hypothetical protein